VSTFFKQIHLLIHINLLLIYIIYGDRTIIGFVGLVVNLLNKLTDGATVSARKSYFLSACEYVKLSFSLQVLKKMLIINFLALSNSATVIAAADGILMIFFCFYLKNGAKTFEILTLNDPKKG
jgi:hypothetical protein